MPWSTFETRVVDDLAAATLGGMGRDLQHRACARRAARVSVAGRAIVHGDHGVTACEIVDVSLGGFLLQCESVSGAMPEVGDPVTVELHLRTARSRWYDLSAHVSRLADGGRIVVVLDRIPPDLEDDIEEELVSAVEAEHSPRVVVVDQPGERRRNLVEAVRRACCEPIEASTPLEAIERIEECRTRAAAVIVGQDLTQTQAEELARFLHLTHPEVRVAVIRDPAGACAPLDDGIVELAPEDCGHTARVRDVLGAVCPERARAARN